MFSVLGVGAEVDIASFVKSVSVLFLTLEGKEEILPSVIQDVMLALNFKNKFLARAFPYTEVQ